MGEINSRIERPFDRDADGADPSGTPFEKEDVLNRGGEAAVATAAEGALEAQQPDRVADLEATLRETRERLLRVAADFENYRRRIERDKHDYIKFANERLLRDLLPVLDNLGRAAQHARETGQSPALLAGLELVIQEFLKVLERHGVTAIESLGQPFDPTVHEAFQSVELEDTQPGLVVEEIQKGYLLNGRVLRPALVSVSTAPEQTSPGTRLPVSDDGE